MYVQREHFLDQQNPLELFRVSPFLRFPIPFFFLDSRSWNGALGNGAPGLNHEGRKKGKSCIEAIVLDHEKTGSVTCEGI